MLWELIKLHSRRNLGMYLLATFILLAYILFKPTPHTGIDQIVILISIYSNIPIVGMFHFERPDQSFFHTLPLTRRKLFISELLVAFLRQALTLILVFLLIASGIRSGVQQGFQSPYFPMVRWYELNVLWSVAIPTFLIFSLTIYVSIRMQIKTNKDILKNCDLFTALAVFGFIFWLPFIVLSSGHNELNLFFFNPKSIIIYCVFISCLSLGISIYAYRYLETQS